MAFNIPICELSSFFFAIEYDAYREVYTSMTVSVFHHCICKICHIYMRISIYINILLFVPKDILKMSVDQDTTFAGFKAYLWGSQHECSVSTKALLILKW